ncbi:hypothetical protein [Peterkaempfera bronchialis]|uniref:hypothetical protein n=1 Tax=Peterkaempfera bronchialis TaxID=2126346 RepID=UPI003C2D656A
MIGYTTRRDTTLGEVEGLTVSLSAAEEKLAQLAARKERRQSATFLGMPPFTQASGRGRNDSEAGNRK